MGNGYRRFACRQLDALFNEGTTAGLTDAQLRDFVDAVVSGLSTDGGASSGSIPPSRRQTM